MEPEPYAIILFVPVLIGLGLLCIVRRYRKNFEKEKDCEKNQKKYKDFRY